MSAPYFTAFPIRFSTARLKPSQPQLPTTDLAYGSYDPVLIIELRRSDLEYGDQLELGSQVLRYFGPESKRRIFRVIQLDGDSVVLDGNHPLAGHDLVFEVEIMAAREARDDDFLDGSSPISGQLLH